MTVSGRCIDANHNRTAAIAEFGGWHACELELKLALVTSNSKLPMMKCFPVSGLTLLLAALLASRISHSQALQQEVDGCALLGMLVRTEFGLAIGHGNRHGAMQVRQQDAASVCTQTTRTVTAAFSVAARQFDIHISWGAQPGSENYCPGLQLSQCFPAADPYMPQPDASRSELVARAWRSVRAVIDAILQPVPGSDISRFEQSVLRHDLRLSLAGVRPAGPGVGIVGAD